jgi:hypothetical protein
MQPLPYTDHSQHLVCQILREPLQIPYENRPFEWTSDKYIRLVITTMIEQMRKGIKHWLGPVVILNFIERRLKDAQHRLTICFLSILAVSRLLGDDEPLDDISKYGSSKRLRQTIPTPEDAATLKRFQWKRIPNIRSIYEHDFQALGNVLNGIDPTNAEAAYEDSRIYAAYECARDTIAAQLTTPSELERFYEYLTQHVHVDLKLTSDPEFAHQITYALNSIKEPLKPITLLRGEFMDNLGMRDTKASAHVHTTFEALERDFACSEVEFNAYVHTAINLKARRFTTKAEYNDHIKELFASIDWISPAIDEFAAILRSLLAIKRCIEGAPIGELVLRMANGYEVLHHCVLPAFYFAPSPLDMMPLLDMIAALGILWESNLSFNAVAIHSALWGSPPKEKTATQLKKEEEAAAKAAARAERKAAAAAAAAQVAKKVTKATIRAAEKAAAVAAEKAQKKATKQQDAETAARNRRGLFNLAYEENWSSAQLLGALHERFNAWLDKDTTPVIKRLCEADYRGPKNSQRVRNALIWLQLKKHTNESTLNQGLVDLEHISPQSAPTPWTYRLGNHTLLLKGKSDTMRGNRSLQDMPYAEKRPEYLKSNIGRTQDIARRYATWDDTSIEAETPVLARELVETAAAILGRQAV